MSDGTTDANMKNKWCQLTKVGAPETKNRYKIGTWSIIILNIKRTLDNVIMHKYRLEKGRFVI